MVTGSHSENIAPCLDNFSSQQDVASAIPSEGILLSNKDDRRLSNCLIIDSPASSSCLATSVTHASSVYKSPLFGTGHPDKSGTGVFLGGRYSVEDIVAFGGISPPSRGARSSPRILKQKDADATQMERAQNLAKAKDAAFSSGTSYYSRFSLASIPDDVVADRAKSMGVLLGTSSSQVLESIHNIKEMDNNRTLIMITKNLEEAHPDQSTSSDIINHATSLSTDLDDNSQLVPEEQTPGRVETCLKTYRRRPKVAPKTVRRSVRISKQNKGA
jgi:hypothetical protein